MNAWNEYSEFTDKCADVLNVQVMLLATSNACLLSKELEDFIKFSWFTMSGCFTLRFR